MQKTKAVTIQVPEEVFEKCSHYAKKAGITLEEFFIYGALAHFSVSQILKVSALNYGKYLVNLKNASFKPDIPDCDKLPF